MVAHGVGSKQLSEGRRVKPTQARKRARKAQNTEQDLQEAAAPLIIPSINENDLFSFQVAHFGDDVRPSMWFVEAEIALNYDPQLDDDGLGYYEDGAKRTLTDAQIEMFRHSEMEDILRAEKLRTAQESPEDSPAGVVESSIEVDDVSGAEDRTASPLPDLSDKGLPPAEKPASPRSNTSSLEEEPADREKTQPKAPPADIRRQQSSSKSWSRSRTRFSNKDDMSYFDPNPKTRVRPYETPYDHRHKRTWEDYIEENDPVKGSLTHRRIAREMDELQSEEIDLDY